MQQPTGQFVYINGGAGLHQPMQQNVVANPQQRQQYVVMSAPMQIATPSSAYANYKRGASKVMGAMQIVMAVFLIGLNIGIAVVDYNNMWLVSSGWWAAPFIIIAGAFGIGAGSSPSHCTVVTTMVMSIFSCLCVVGILVQGSLGIAVGCDYYYPYYGCYYYNETPHIITSSFFILFGIGEINFALIQSILCCQGCCNKPTIQANQIGPVQIGYTNGGFVPCYVHPQAQAQSTFVQPVAQAFQLQQQDGAIGQNTPISTAQNVGMVTAQADGATDEAATIQHENDIIYNVIDDQNLNT